MCFEIEQLTKSEYGKHYLTYEQMEQEKAEIEEYLDLKAYHVSGFSHPLISVITDDQPYRFQAFRWGLIPFFTKNKSNALKSSNNCLNARGETIWEKPSFRKAAEQRRCLITCIDGFFEYHHFNGKAYPFFISLKNNEPMTFAGLWERWEDKETKDIIHTTTIVTTVANDMMAYIHNNDRALKEGPRMPVILPKELMRDWLKPINDKADKELLQELIKPYDQDEMQAWTVRQLKGKNGVGDTPIAREPFDYEELPI